MSIVDNLVEDLVERNAFRLTGSLTLRLVDGGIQIGGTLRSTLRDQKKNKDVLNVNIPVAARLTIGEIVVPLPRVP